MTISLMRALRSSTALALALALALPAPLPLRAQDLAECAPGGEVPCVGPEGEVVETLEDLLVLFLGMEAPEAVPEAEPVPEVVPEAIPEPEVVPEVTPEAEAVPEQAPVEQPVEEAPVVPQPEAEPAPETAPQPEAVPEQAPVETPEPMPEPAPEPEPEPVPEPAPEAPPVTEVVPPAEPAPEPDAEVTPEAEAQPEAAPEVAPAEATAPSDAPEATPQADADPAPADPAPTAETALPPEPEPVLVEEPPATAAAAASQDDAAAPDAAVIEEVVTDETARSATEDFATTVSGRNRDGQDSDRGLSDFEKALIVGLGAVAVGTLLNNGNRVVANSGDRVVVQDDRGALTVLKDEDALLRQPGSRVRTETFDDGSSRSFVTREDGSRIETIMAADGRVLRRARILPDGTEFLLFDDTLPEERIDVTRLPTPTPALTLDEIEARDTDALARALDRLRAEDAARVDATRFSLRQVREVRQVRELAPAIEVDITFATGSSAIAPEQAVQLLTLGQAMSGLIASNPREVFLVEGHTDATGAAEFNLALSDRRAESVALALSQFFGVPPENMVVQGYGESALLVPTLEAEALNRRATVRRITPLLREVVASR